VVEEKEFERVGGTRVIQSDFRLIAATNQNLEDMLSDGRFRKDLFYRLNVIPLNIPPLRERRDDIIPLTRHFMQQMAQEAAFSKIKMGPEAEKALERHDWPGNVRELLNVLERTLSTIETDTIRLVDLPFYLHRTQKTSPHQNRTSIREVQALAEKEAIRYALKETHHNKVKAAKILGIHRTLLYKKMKKYNLSLGPEV
jgi:transcriptional regulator with PAS, ATPase and Fis domain